MTCPVILRAAIVLAATVAVATAQDSKPAASPVAAINLRVVVVGEDAARSRDLADALGTAFTSVKIAAPTEFAAAARDADVTVLDLLRDPAAPGTVPEELRTWTKPVVLVGGGGGRVAERLGLKLGARLSVLGGIAHGIVADHDVFREPFDAGVSETEVTDVPRNYAGYPEGDRLGTKTLGWSVEKGAASRPARGAAADGYGFVDSPDCEILCGGVNSGAPGAVAVGRQGNFLLWGFDAPPSEMTAGARRAFLNAVAYVARFDGAPVLVRDPAPAREWAVVHARRLSDPATAAEAKASLSPRLLVVAHGDPAFVRELVANGFERLRADRGGDGRYVFSIDEDVAALGIGNREPQIIGTCLNLIGHREQVDRAHRLLVRYLALDLGPDYAHWTSWWRTHEPRVFFSDTAGYRFVVKPEAPGGRKGS